ncbi:hypothetical protein GCM10011343_15860 [Flavobacterium orientale]|uniref:Tetratricopeptide repeat-containing protein n=2 Tax=Flavobacterium orientale TaxID=1756020 RepID=A0A916Y1P4_9FLAO|nr:hypothetical protein GCM10011343_15860 [Flavobacterium orientale]
MIATSQNHYHQNVFKSAKNEFTSFKKSGDVNQLSNAFEKIEIIRTSKDNELSNYEIYDFNDFFLFGEIYFEIFESYRKGILKKSYNPNFLRQEESGRMSFVIFLKLFDDFPKNNSLRNKIIEYFKKLEISLSDEFIITSENYNYATLNDVGCLIDLQNIYSHINHENFDNAKLEKYTFWYAGTAVKLGMKNKALEKYIELYNKNYKEVIVYAHLFDLTIDTNEKQAFEYLEKGKILFSDNPDLIGRELLHYKNKKEYDLYVQKFIDIASKDPKNISLQIDVITACLEAAIDFQYESSEFKKFEEKALKHYDLVLKKSPNETEVYFYLGLFYGKISAGLMQELQKTNDNQQKTLIEQKIAINFNKMKSYLKDAERSNPNHLNTLTILHAIYKEEGDVKLTKEFQTRIDNFNNNVSNSSYFKANN